MSQNDNGKLIATAVGAAAAGASLAVLAMKMIDAKYKYGSSSGDDYPNKRAIDPYPHYNIRNDNSMLITDPSERLAASIPTTSVQVAGAAPPNKNLNQHDSEQMLFPHNHEEKMRRRIATRYTIEEENNLPRSSVTVRVPATSANVGPGCKLFFVLDSISTNDMILMRFSLCFVPVVAVPRRQMIVLGLPSICGRR